MICWTCDGMDPECPHCAKLTDLRKAVFEALDNAVENNTDFSQFKDATAIAIDLGTHDADLKGMETAELVPHVEAWLRQHDAE